MNEITITIPDAQQLPPSLLSNIETGFKSAFEQAEKWRQQAMAIQVTSLDQNAEMKLARTIRLELKNIRVAAEKQRVALKANALLMGKAIDGVNNLLLAAIVPLEKHLEEQEQYGERLAAAERQRHKAEREELLAPFLSEGQPVAMLEMMSGEQWDSYLADAKLLHSAKIEAARKAEADRIAKEQAEAAARERMRLENERLRVEAAAAMEQARAQEALRKAEQVAAAREAAAREAARIAELAEIAAMQAKAEREAKALRDAEAERLRVEAAKVAAELKAKSDADAKASRAPDKLKLRGFAQQVRLLVVPEASTDAGRSVAVEIAAKVAAFATWIETQTKDL